MDKSSFCPSPWFHILISADGSMHFCRWGERREAIDPNHNIRDMSMQRFLNSDFMALTRKDLLDGTSPSRCIKCYEQDKVGKVNGRLKQLYKCNIKVETFDEDYQKSPYRNFLDYSIQNNGATLSTITDLQVDLGSICNGACIYCSPESSTKIYEEYANRGWLSPQQLRGSFNWSRNPTLLQKFIDELVTMKDLKYVHFIGGEPLYMDSFKTICRAMSNSGLHKQTIMGFTTNCTVFDESIWDILKDFKAIHLGLSIDCPTRLNDYVRWPARIETVMDNISKFRSVGSNVHIQIRPAPTVFSIYHYHYLVDWLLENNLHSEVCNFLTSPTWLKIQLLPKYLRNDIVNNISTVLNKHQLTRDDNVGIVIDTRTKGKERQVVLDDAIGYMNFLKIESESTEKERRLFVARIKELEITHKNNILDYLPEYTDFMREYGYDK